MVNLTQASRELFSRSPDERFTSFEELNQHCKLKDSVEEMSPLGEKATIFTDLLNAALSEFNWHEMAEAFAED